uniref:Putative F-box and FNIP repeat-containing protein n=1 Tax=Moumouvirus sp. 'Monve' TaxID=1128131 RepID=H2EDA2_9VIRU|nr:putative F-box and FNIP repeat-containing protein [Moumouvirus Monve]
MAIFQTLDDNIIGYILSFVQDHDKLNFISTCQDSKKLLLKNIYYDNIYDYDEVKHLSYINQIKNISYYAFKKNIPKITTHLTFSYNFNEPLQECIPDGVKK